MSSVFARHDRIALSFSGGKDSLACAYLLRPVMDRVTIYHNDTGDLLPEVREVVEHVRSFWTGRFVTVQGDVNGWIDQHGLPTDLLPYTAHPIGEMMGHRKHRLVTRYDCCFANLMWPVMERMKANGNTLVIRGTKTADLPKLPAKSGDTWEGVEIYLPLADWTNADVFAYLRSVDAPIARIYDHYENAPECATCSAWCGEKRAAYLARFHPDLLPRYAERMRAVADEISSPLASFQAEAARCDAAPDIGPHLLDDLTDATLKTDLRILQGARFAPTDEGHVAELLRYMAPPGGARIADIGCGFGEVARLMNFHRPDLDFLLINNNAKQLSHAPGMFDRLEADMHALPLPDASVDGAMFCYSLCHADFPRALGEAARITRPGGFLFVYDYDRDGGDNDLFRTRLIAHAIPWAQMKRIAMDAGWLPVAFHAPEADDTIFRALYGNDAEYDTIFRHLTPVVWKMRRA
jgi:3'-phosphoadenosine 5'-phosphosulfate sulfotransferase (PAPS reductase)/FAD synthetase/SAM-dependent methyltransferase